MNQVMSRVYSLKNIQLCGPRVHLWTLHSKVGISHDSSPYANPVVSTGMHTTKFHTMSDPFKFAGGSIEAVQFSNGY